MPWRPLKIDCLPSPFFLGNVPSSFTTHYYYFLIMNNFPLSLRRRISTQNFPVDAPWKGPIPTRAHRWAPCSHTAGRVRVHPCSSYLLSSFSWPDAYVSFVLLSACLSASRSDSGYDPRRARASRENASRVAPCAGQQTQSRVPHPGKCPSTSGLLPAGQTGPWA